MTLNAQSTAKVRMGTKHQASAPQVTNTILEEKKKQLTTTTKLANDSGHNTVNSKYYQVKRVNNKHVFQ